MKRRVTSAVRHKRAKALGLAFMGGYEVQLEKQKGGCAICGRRPKPGGRRLNIDHHHKTGVVRGLLCHRCNRGLSFFSDDPVVLFGAALYLKHGWRASVTFHGMRA